MTFPGGARMAIEVQLGRVTDTQLLVRRADYAREDIALVWVWESERRIPHVLFRFGEPGWVFDPAADRTGLACGRAHAGHPPGGTAERHQSAHWPPCPGDDLEVRWMPLADVRLTKSGFLPSPGVTARLEEEAAAVAQRVQDEQAARRASAAASLKPTIDFLNSPDSRAYPQPPVQPSWPHLALRIDARPPWSHPLGRLYWCPQCDDYLTGAQLQSSPVLHDIPGPDRWIAG